MSRDWQIDLTDAPRAALAMEYPEVGDVYKKAGGKPGFWVIVAISGDNAHVIAFDHEGVCTGTQSYRASYFAENSSRKVGVAMNLPNKIAIAWSQS